MQISSNTNIRLTAPEEGRPRGPIVATTATSTEANGALAYNWERIGPLEFSTSITVAPTFESVTVTAAYQDACTTYDGLEPDRPQPLNRDEGGISWATLRYTQFVESAGSCTGSRRAIASWTVTATTNVEGTEVPVATWDIVNWSIPGGRNGTGCSGTILDESFAVEAFCRTSLGTAATVQEPFSPEDEPGWILSIRP